MAVDIRTAYGNTEFSDLRERNVNPPMKPPATALSFS